MPAPKVRADYDQLTKISQLFDQQAEVAQRLTQDLKQKEQVLQGGDWIGQGAQAFYAEMEQGILIALNRLIQALREAGHVTQAISNLVQATEQGASNTFKKGAQDVASGKSAAGMAAAGGATLAGIGIAGLGGASAGGAAGAGGFATGGTAGGTGGGIGGSGGPGSAGAAAGAAAGIGISASLSINIPSWLSKMLGLGGNGATQGSGDKLDQFVDQIHNARDMLAGGGAAGLDGSDSYFNGQPILDAVKSDLANQAQTAANGWQQNAAGSGGGSGGGSGSGAGAGGGSPTPTDTKQSGGGGGGGGSQSPTGGGSMGSGGSGNISGKQGMVTDAAAQAGGSSGGTFGSGGTPASFGAAMVAGSLRAAAAGAPIAEVALMVGASAGGLLFASKGSVAGGLAGQFARNAASPLFKSVSG